MTLIDGSGGPRDAELVDHPTPTGVLDREAEHAVAGLTEALRAARAAVAREFGTDEVRTSQPRLTSPVEPCSAKASPPRLGNTDAESGCAMLLIWFITVPVVLFLVWAVVTDLKRRRRPRNDVWSGQSADRAARETRVVNEGKASEWGAGH